MYSLVGRLEFGHIQELEGVLGPQEEASSVVLDLREVRLVDREAVQSLARWEAKGVQLENCPAYIREWIGKEQI